MIKPYQDTDAGKKEQVQQMFDNIAKRYDFLNHFLSMGIDKKWRKKAIKMLNGKYEKPNVLDVACGTGDFSISALKLNPEKIQGIDLSSEMLEVGQKKIQDKGLQDKIELSYGDSERIDFHDKKFDIVMAAFGVRNFEDLKLGLSEMYRVLKDNGTCLILEFSKPEKGAFKQLYNFYFKSILPVVGRVVSKDNSAYTYLPESVNEFPEGEDFLKLLQEVGFKDTELKVLTFGVASVYLGRKIVK